MSFQYLPVEVQVVAARMLSEMIMNPERQKEPVELAREVRDAFTELHSPSEFSSTQNDNG